ncbi:hypothetical protein CAPTEDRAFT_224450 [Capitella teleta]|uniref:Uncharacterized protein n=1 Tax=Capitella teleta TaxID=283909 RepID=R7TMM2_CAPTE|nr:hypothetical protein CAPTEDRAFT_224450 [Capitella teleta]|eukprot:ELT95123.1 hypothetical protein CAPTEDRAFT_224450 [Capitella teleta]
MTSAAAKDDHSVFHVALNGTAEQCGHYVTDYADCLERLCGSGLHAAQTFALLLADSPFAEIAGQFLTRSQEMDEMARCDVKQLKTEMQRHSHDKDPQSVARTLAQLLQTQLHFFQLAVNHLSHLAQFPPPSSQSQSSSSIQGAQSEVNDLNSKPAAKPIDSPNRIKRHFSSLFSKFGAKNSNVSDSSSAFYVDLDKTPTSSEAGPLEDTQQATGQRSAFFSRLHHHLSTAVSSAPSPVAIPEGEGGGEVASQEELDLVINMLSRGPPRMHAIPEVPPRPPPSTGLWAPNPPLDGRNNTWPFKVNRSENAWGKAWGPQDPLGRPPLPPQDVSDVGVVPKQWSSTADSGSCSDESSSNGEWLMMGLEQVNAMQQQQVHRRRHSSGENPLTTNSNSVTLGTVTMATPPLNKSVESLLLEPKLTNTWPPKHPWANTPADPSPSPSAEAAANLKPPIHRPLSNQWSDPLSVQQQHLSVWEHGMMLGARQGYGVAPSSCAPPGEMGAELKTGGGGKGPY